MKIGIVILGCDKNTVDSEYAAGILERSGIEVTAAGQEPENDDLDAVLIQTCGFITAAKAESIASIVSWVEHKKSRLAAGGTFRVLVSGCLSQRYRASLIAELPEVDGFLGVGEFEKIVPLVAAGKNNASTVNQIRELPAVVIASELPRKELGAHNSSAFLKIGDGCNHNCTFCAIPSFKGRLCSVPKEILLAEAKLLLTRGVKEIVLVAQDTSDYGKDIYGKEYGIAHLLRDLTAVDGDFRIRILYFYPGGLTAEFLDVFGSSPKIAHYLDMPLQHLHPDILRLMKRPHANVSVPKAVDRLRRHVPDVVLRTTFIVGFPGETEDHFQYLLQGIRDLRFGRLGAFAYSAEEGTPAATMKPVVTKRVRQRRLDDLLEAQAQISFEQNEEMIGRRIRVLVEEQVERKLWRARGDSDAPEVDGAVFVTSDRPLKIHEFADVTVTGADVFDLNAVTGEV